jgi:hypothetical protein
MYATYQLPSPSIESFVRCQGVPGISQLVLGPQIVPLCIRVLSGKGYNNLLTTTPCKNHSTWNTRQITLVTIWSHQLQTINNAEGPITICSYIFANPWIKQMHEQFLFSQRHATKSISTLTSCTYLLTVFRGYLAALHRQSLHTLPYTRHQTLQNKEEINSDDINCY